MSVYNGSQTIMRCINSMLSQTFTDFEFIIVNDGSTDHTVELIKGFQDPRINIIDLDHIGLAKALNYGLTKCKGKYIARLDADDWCHKDRLACQYEYLENNPQIDVVSSLVSYEGNRLQNPGYALHVDWINSLISHEEMFIKRFEDSPVANPSCMIRKSIVDKFGYYNERELPEDYEFWLRLFDSGLRFAKIDKTLFHWSDLPSRITRTHSNYAQDKFFEVKSYYLAKWIKKTFDRLPDIYIIGNSTTIRKRVQLLQGEGIAIHKFVDLKVSGHKNTITYSELPSADNHSLILSYIGDRKGKLELAKLLKTKLYAEGRDFLFVY